MTELLEIGLFFIGIYGFYLLAKGINKKEDKEIKDVEIKEMPECKEIKPKISYERRSIGRRLADYREALEDGRITQEEYDKFIVERNRKIEQKRNNKIPTKTNNFSSRKTQRFN